MKVYAVERGSYSDYRVVALFAHRADAEAAAKIEGGEAVVRTVYDKLPPPTPYYVIERVGLMPETLMRTVLIQAWDGPYWTGRMVRGVAFKEWKHGVRVWGTDKEGVRRRWQEYTQQQEAAGAGL